MVNRGKPAASGTRRDVLRGIGAASVSALVGGALPATVSASTGDATVLGDFESGLGGWQANGEADLDRVEVAERPIAVTSGNYGLAVTTTDDLRVGIANETRVADADFVEHPYLFATVTPGRIPGTESAVSVRFRLHYGEDGLLGDELSVVESASTTVRPHVASIVTWDVSSLDEAVRANASRLEIVWSPEVDLSTEALLGDGSDEEWTVVVDDVHLGDDGDRYELVRMADQWERLQFANGAYRETRVRSETDLLESGEFVFADGTAIPYTVERLTGGATRYVVDGVAYQLGGER